MVCHIILFFQRAKSELVTFEGSPIEYLNRCYYLKTWIARGNLVQKGYSSRSILELISGDLPTIFPGRPFEPKISGSDKSESPSLCNSSARPCTPSRGFSGDDCMAFPSFSVVTDFKPNATMLLAFDSIRYISARASYHQQKKGPQINLRQTNIN